MDIETINLTPYVLGAGLGLGGFGIAWSTTNYFLERREKMLDFYRDNIKGKPEHEKIRQYKWAEEEGLIGDIPTQREIPRLEKRYEKRLFRRENREKRIESVLAAEINLK